MPKSSDNKNKPKKNKLSPNTSNDSAQPKKKCKSNDNDSIDKSRQLANKSINTRKRILKKNKPRAVENGKPMPSLSELEKMFQDSDDDKNVDRPHTENITENLHETVETPALDHNVSNPMQPGTDLLSPDTINKVAIKMLEVITNLSDSVSVGDPEVPDRVIPVKKPKKSDVPYIVGCKDRPQVPQKPNVKFCIGDDYGITKKTNELPNEDEVEKCNRKQRKSSQNANTSKSIFNAKSDEIAEFLKHAETQSEKSSDSSKTVPYVYSSNSSNANRRAFSPLPSTSRDNDTIMKNEQLLNESLNTAVTQNEGSAKNEIEIIEVPYETIVIDDGPQDMKPDLRKISPLNSVSPSNSIQYIEPEVKHNTDNIDLTDKDEYYKSIEIHQNIDDECEIVDVDEVIAENRALINQYNTNHTPDVSITNVIPQEIYVPPTIQNVTTNKNNSDTITEILTSFFNHKPKPCLMTKQNVSLHERIDHRTDVSQLSHKVTNWLSTLKNIEIPPSINTSQDVIICDSPIAFSSEQTQPHLVSGPHVMPIINPERSVETIDDSVCIVDDESQEKNYQKVSPRKAKARRNFGDCPICMDILGTTPVASTTCGHVFCMSCIEAALRINRKKCPTCRKSLKGIGYHQLFL